MRKIFFILLFFAFATYGQQERIAILNTLANPEGSVELVDLDYLTDVLSHVVVNKLSMSDKCYVMDAVSVVDFFGSQDRMMEECSKTECDADVARIIEADYTLRAIVRYLSYDRFSIKVELRRYKSGSELIGSFTGDAYSLEGLRDIIYKEAQGLLKKIPCFSKYMQAKESVRFTEDKKALEAERRRQEKEQARIEALEAERRKQAEKQAKKEALEAEKLEKARVKELEAERRRQANKSYSNDSYISDYNKKEFFEIGWQYIWDMHHLRLAGDWFYCTLGLSPSKGVEKDLYSEEEYDVEWIAGIISRQVWVWNWSNGIKDMLGFGLFGGLGARHISEETIMRHELGIEFILGYFSAYITERNFYRIGGGVGLIF